MPMAHDYLLMWCTRARTLGTMDENGPAGCLYSISDSWWMERANFLQWFSKMFLPAVKYCIPVVFFFFFDGHCSHISLDLLDLVRSKQGVFSNIYTVCADFQKVGK